MENENTTKETRGRNCLHFPSAGHLHLLILLNRFCLGWYLLLAGWGKVQNEWAEGLGAFFRSDSYQRRTPGWLPEVISVPYGYALPWAELFIGALLALGLFGRVASWGTVLILGSIFIALLNSGDLLPRHHVLVFFPLSLLLLAYGPGKYSIDALLAHLCKPNSR